ncbi:hypothetical protein FBF29_04085 [Candidatus Saccharibacteria bacterium oral taxon 488]|jgi:hypothetical protein|nr:hypothetical protein FBF29_04085 [Candidatus Saccharibacteria bacterium oral taxon 488]
MSELLQTGERGRELTDAEWKRVDELVDKTGCSYYGARWALGLKPPADQNAHAVDERLSDQNIPADKKPRSRKRSYFAAFDTRTQQAHDASGQGPLTEEQKQTNRDGIVMARAAFRKARAA